MNERDTRVKKILIDDNGIFPNNGRLPLLLYPRGFNPSLGEDPDRGTITDLAENIESAVTANGWPASWRNGVYPYHHYHSTAHELLGVFNGWSEVQFGGDDGPVQKVVPGDVVLIPAGVAHKLLAASADFTLVGAYPEGQSPDMNYGKEGERPRTDRNIAQVRLPRTDPVFGPDGPLSSFWVE